MSWLPMELGNLPRLICGPILRRVDDESVTVWLVLKRMEGVAFQDPVGLKVRDRGGNEVMSGSAVPTTIGRLQVVAVRATGKLVPGQAYDYSLLYGKESVFVDQKAQDKKAKESQCNFVYMPEKLSDVQIAHASCRKPDGEGRDALASLYREIERKRVKRPHLLLLTGDQIYADGVAGPLLFMIMDAMPALLGGLKDSEANADQGIEPFLRVPLLETAKIRHSYRPDCHLVGFQEYFLMHLFVWSEDLWGAGLPTLDEAADRLLSLGYKYPEYRASHRAKWDQQCAALQRFREDLPAVRALLCSTPTLMIFDDHEVTDDWRLNEKWIKDVIGTPLGKRIELNALLAYMLAQASGNDAEYFNKLFPDIFRGNDVAVWRKRDANSPGVGLATLLGWEGLRPQQRVGVEPNIGFHYKVALPACHVVVLDTRTRRGFDRGAYASLIAIAQIADQIGGSSDVKPLLLVSPSPLFGHAVTEMMQVGLAENKDLNHAVYKVLDSESMKRIARDSFDPLLNVDAEAWGLERDVRAHLVHQLCNEWPNAPFIVVLSGDIHFAYTQSTLLEKPNRKTIVQLTSSAILNSEFKSYALALDRPDLSPLVSLILGGANSPLIEEGSLKYRLRLHKASIETTSEHSLLMRILLGEKLDEHAVAKALVRFFDAYVCGQNNCGLIAFPKPEELTHTLITDSLAEKAYMTWAVPV